MKKRLALLTALVFLVPAGSARATPFVIQPGEYGVNTLGPFKTKWSRSYAPDIGAATRAFGAPSNSFPSGWGGCVVKWKRYGLRIEFYNFGGDPRGTCHPEVGLAQSFTIEDSRKWRSWKGLRIGMPEADVERYHGWAEWHDGGRFNDPGYWLRAQFSPFGDGSEYAVVAAHLRHDLYGKVAGFSGWIGAAGE